MNQWNYQNLKVIMITIKKISLGEGNTPLIRLQNIERLLKWKGTIWGKAEYQNPTGSFKDRGSIVEISEAIQLNKLGVVCASTGNMAASLAAYSTKAKLPCFVVIPLGTPVAKLTQAVICNAKIIKTIGNYDKCIRIAKQFASKNNYLLCGDYKTRRLGQQSIGVELAQSKIRFDAFICPVGNGTVGCAVAEGFSKNKQRPQFIGVQGKGADPIYQAWKNKTMIKKTVNPTTIASAMNVGNPLDGKLTLNWINKTNGFMISVSDTEICNAQKILAVNEGIFVEKASASTLTTLLNINTKKNKEKNIVLILTGNGLKEGGEIND